MTDDVTIPREMAKRLAVLLRREDGTTKEERMRLADLLDPPPSARKWDPKWLREVLCQQQVLAPYTRDRELMQELVDRLDLHRPLGSDGKHNNLHTPTCGCDDEALGVTDE